MRFTDGRAAGRALAEKLGDYAGREDVVVLALARGGVGVGLEVSKWLGLPLDLVLIRRMLVPRGPDDPVCVASAAGSLFLDEELSARAADAREPAFESFLAGALAEFEETARACRGGRPALNLSGKTTLLVDNGVRTGSTLRVAVRAVRSTSPARVVAAAPVAAADALDAVRRTVDDFIHLASPEPFGHVGIWYADFARPTDDEIRAMLEESERG
jgi:putative phosphoribosyl transferase